MHTASLLSRKLSGNRMRTKLDKDPLAVKQNIYTTKIVNAFIVYDLDAWPRNAAISFKFQNCLFHATCIVKSNDEEKWV